MRLSDFVHTLPEPVAFMTGLPISIVFMVIGIALLVKGGNWTVDGAVFVARRYGLSPLLVGFTIVAFGTSLPELVVSVLAQLEGSTGIALGNVMGSNIANILLVIGAAAIIAPLVSHSKAVDKDIFMMILATCILVGLMLYGELSRAAGGVMVMLLVGYVFYQYKMVKKGEMPMEEAEGEEIVFSKPLQAYGFLVLGLIGIAAGAEFLVTGAQETAAVIGVPDAVIGLSVIALGTSLPELSTSIIAVRKGHSGIVLGNIIGSNVFNILMILGVTALVKPIVQGSFDMQLVNFDVWFMAFTTCVFGLMVLYMKKVPRVAGVLFCAVYIAYNAYIYAIHIGS